MDDSVEDDEDHTQRSFDLLTDNRHEEIEGLSQESDRLLHITAAPKKRSRHDSQLSTATRELQGTFTFARIDGDDVIGDLLAKHMTPIPFAIDPFGFGRIKPLTRTFLFRTTPAQQLSFPASCPHTSEMHHRVTSFPSPVGILPHTPIAFGRQRAPTHFMETHSRHLPPSLSTLQNLGLCICKSFAPHIKYACQKFRDCPPVQNSQRPDPIPVRPW
jgi:hypothetical protein